MNASSIPFLLGLVAAVFVVVVAVALRHPIQRRFALRNMARRPWETALVIGGSLLGGALITGSFIVGDTLDASIRATAHTQLGPVDEYVVVPQVAQRERVERKIAAIDDDRIDGVVSLVSAPVTVAAERSGDVLAQPRAQLVEIDFPAGRRFGGDPAVTGLDGDTPGRGEVVVTEHLAETLQADGGDSVTLYVYDRKVELRVARILPARGVAGFWTGIESTSANAFVAPGTLADLTLGGVPAGAVPPAATVLVSNRGGVEDGAALTGEVTALVEEALAGTALRVEEAKQRVLEAAEAEGDAFGELFLAIGTFAIIAGILLLVNIFVMLSEERKGQLGMLRAVGLRRSDLVRSFAVEGLVYALAAGVLGAFLGIGVGRGIVLIAAPIFGGFGDFSLDLRFAFSWASVAGGFCLGVLIAFFTVVLTSLRISRTNIIRAIRDLPDPPRGRARLRTLVMGGLTGLLGLAWFASALGGEDPFGMILGPPLAAFGLLPLLAKLVQRRVAVLVVAGFSLLWGIFGNALTDSGFFAGGEIFAFVVQGVLLTFSAVVLLSQAQETFEGGIRKVAARHLPLRLGLAYPLAHRFRTGLTLGMYSLVIFTMVFIAVLAQVFGGQVDTAVAKEGGEWEIVVRANEAAPPSPDELARIEGVEQISTMVAGTALFHPDGIDEPRPWDLAGIEASFTSVVPPRLEERAPEFETDEEVWNAVAKNPRLAIVPSFFLQTGGGPPASLVEIGEKFAVVDPSTGKRVEREVAAVGSSFPVFMSRPSVEEALGGRVAPARFYLTAEGDPEALTAQIQGEFVRNGARADTFRSVVEGWQRANLQFMNLMQSYLALGLLVGIAGLGVVMVRSVRERRREVGVLRSLGFVPGQVRRAFTLESGFTALEGIVVGTVLSLVTASQLVATGEFGEGIEFMVPWTHVLALCGAALAASLLATAWPAQQASRIAPAVALRTAE